MGLKDLGHSAKEMGAATTQYMARLADVRRSACQCYYCSSWCRDIPMHCVQCLQAQADAMGTWGMSGQNDSGPRRAWEGDGRIDLRSVTNSQRQLPYHVRHILHAAFKITPQILSGSCMAL